jgi:hypothetical protein
MQRPPDLQMRSQREGGNPAPANRSLEQKFEHLESTILACEVQYLPRCLRLKLALAKPGFETAGDATMLRSEAAGRGVSCPALAPGALDVADRVVRSEAAVEAEVRLQ